MMAAIQNLRRRSATHHAVSEALRRRDSLRAMALEAMTALGTVDLMSAIEISVIRIGRPNAKAIRNLAHKLDRYADELERNAPHHGDVVRQAGAGSPPSIRPGE